MVAEGRKSKTLLARRANREMGEQRRHQGNESETRFPPHPGYQACFHRDVVHFETQKDPSRQSQASRLVSSQQYEMESARPLPGRMCIAHTDEEGRQNLEPALSLTSPPVDATKGARRLPSTSESAYPRGGVLGCPTPWVLRMNKAQV